MPGIKTAAVICHARFLDLAWFGEILGQKEYDVRYYDAGQDSLSLDGEPDVLITLGGPVGRGPPAASAFFRSIGSQTPASLAFRCAVHSDYAR
jgi:hypothetical protein